jgi:hypothetical protein
LTTEELLQEQNYTSEEQDKNIADTAFNQVDLATDEHLRFGTIKITDEYAKQAAWAMKSRIDGTKDDTKKLRDNIKKNVQLYELKGVVGDSTTKVPLGAIRTSCDDWIDDLTEIFRKLPDSIFIKAKKNMQEKFVSKILPADRSDFSKQMAMTYDLLQGKAEEMKKTEGITDEQMKLLNQLTEKNVYYFSVMDSIKQMLIDALDNADFNNKIERLIYNGVVKKMFIIKKQFNTKDSRALKVFESDEKEGLFTNFKLSTEQKKIFNFTVIDPEKMIFRSDTLKGWKIEEIDYNFYELLNMVLDDNGKPKPDALYDCDRLKKVEELLKESVPQKKAWEEDDPTVSTLGQVKLIDGDIVIYEGHEIPFRYNIKDLLKRKDGAKLTGLSPNGEITLSSTITSIHINGVLIPIGIQPEIFSSVYDIEVYAESSESSAGMALPDVLEKAEGFLNDIYNKCYDLIKLSVNGNAVVDEDAVVNTNQLNGINSNDAIKLKDLNGRKIGDVIQWFRPPLDAVQFVISVCEKIEFKLAKLSRKGPTGEKIAPNPSATEFTSMIRELQKTVNRVGMRINSMFVRLLMDIYLYSLLTQEDKFKLQTKGYKLNSLPAGYEIKEVLKQIESTPEELWIDGIDFEIKCLENAEKEALQKSQQLQFVDMLIKDQLVFDPMGMPRKYIDDAGNPVTIDMFKLLDTTARYMQIDSIWRKVQELPPVPTAPVGTVQPTGQSLPNTSLPPIDQKPDMATLIQKGQAV